MTDPEKPAPQPPTEQPSKTPRCPVRSLDELRERGVPIGNDLIISPVPRKT